MQDATQRLTEMRVRQSRCAGRGGRLVVAVLACTIASAELTSAAAADVAYGAYLSSECSACHRNDGENKGIPSIVGWPPENFISALQSYKAKTRSNTIMQTITGRLSNEDMAALAAYYATLKKAP